MNTQAQIREKLAVLAPLKLEIVDDSAKHAGHAGAASGGGHFNLLIVSKAFEDINQVARHRLIYAALGDMMRATIHALKIVAKTPAETNGNT